MLLAFSVSAQSAPLNFQSSNKQTVLLELYTSEGCSSCPPAEVRLSRLKESAGLWKDFVPVAFHVDYWDYLGWPDPWSSKLYSERQRDYAQTWRSDFIYTPCFVRNGMEGAKWTGNAPMPSDRKSGVLTAVSNDTNRWRITFASINPGGNYEVYAALLAGGLVSDVRAGENRGRRLQHDFVVLKLANAPMIRRSGVLETQVAFAAGRDSSPDLALAVWVTILGRPEPLQATGGWISRSTAK